MTPENNHPIEVKKPCDQLFFNKVPIGTYQNVKVLYNQNDYPFGDLFYLSIQPDTNKNFFKVKIDTLEDILNYQPDSFNAPEVYTFVPIDNITKKLNFHLAFTIHQDTINAFFNLDNAEIAGTQNVLFVPFCDN